MDKPFISVKGTNIPIPAGPPGPDGNPIGTVISYMGTTAPDGYLICDGSIKNISQFPNLADFFKKQFGSSNYFGGNGTTTFAVPDLRNVFLRGYHGTANTLSGNIGVKQNPTELQGVSSAVQSGTPVLTLPISKSLPNSQREFGPLYPDSITTSNAYSIMKPAGDTVTTSLGKLEYFSTRPMNVAVLFCIKAVISGNVPLGGNWSGGSSNNVYSTEEQVIGTWIDGKPLYRRVVVSENVTRGTGINLHTYDASLINVQKFEAFYRHASTGLMRGSYYVSSSNQFVVSDTNGSITCNLGASQDNSDVTVIFEYTKTTDVATVSLASAPTIIPEIDFDVTEIASVASAAFTFDAPC